MPMWQVAALKQLIAEWLNAEKLIANLLREQNLEDLRHESGASRACLVQ